MEREERYIVLKVKDFEAALGRVEKEQCHAAFTKIALHRHARGAGRMRCVVVEHDWPEYAATWAAIEHRVDSPNTGSQPT
jgi:hypothetical protein